MSKFGKLLEDSMSKAELDILQELGKVKHEIATVVINANDRERSMASSRLVNKGFLIYTHSNGQSNRVYQLTKTGRAFLNR